MKKSKFKIPKMDCPSEINLIKIAFDGISFVKNLEFDLTNRTLEVVHDGNIEEVQSILLPIGLGCEILTSSQIEAFEQVSSMNDQEEMMALKKALFIMTFMFLVEIISGIYADSIGLISDSLDMLADAAVFALSLYAVGKAVHFKKNAAKISGYLQITLVIGTVIELVRKFIAGSEPIGPMMIVIALIALISNALCMWILYRHRNNEVHMKASWIFLSNDVIVNLGVILAGILVILTSSHIPDLIIGLITVTAVFVGAIRILRASA